MITEANCTLLVQLLHQALDDLYDAHQLQTHTLIQLFQLDHHANPALALRQLLIGAIGALRPDAQVPRHTDLYEDYQLLNQRFVEQYPQKEVANDFGLSVRQVRRREQRALARLAASLINEYGLTDLTTVQPTTDALEMTPSRQEELAWSQRTFPSTAQGLACDAVELVTDVTELARPLLRAWHVRVTTHLPESLPQLLVEPVSARQALLGLLTTVARRLPQMRLTLRGEIVMQAVEIQLLREPTDPPLALYDAEAVENLRLVENLLLPSGGKLNLGPKEGQESLIAWITLPCEAQVAVLVVDDNPDTLQLLNRYTANSRFRLIEERRPQEVLTSAAQLLPQIVVLDVMLPEIDGWQLLAQLRAHPALAQTPIIVCTILPQEQLAYALGATGFLRKPIRQDDFLLALEAQRVGFG